MTKNEKDIALKIIEEIDSELHKLALDYENNDQIYGYAICEVIHYKIIEVAKKKYSEDGNA